MTSKIGVKNHLDSPILICAGIGRLAGLFSIQHRVRVGPDITLNKGLMYPYPGECPSYFKGATWICAN